MRSYEHTVDLDHVVALAARYEKLIVEADEIIQGTENEETIRISNMAADALELQQRMFFQVLPNDVREEFWDMLDEALKEPADA